MYLYAVVVLALSALLATTWLQLTSTTIVNAAKHVAARYANVALERAQDELIDALAAQVNANGPRGPFAAPSPGPAQAACAVAPCALFVTTSVQFAGQTNATASGNAIAANLQQNGGVAEGRVSALVGSIVSNASGAILARAARRITLRTFAVAPYVALSGVDEAIAAAPAGADFAGACDGVAACGADSRIHALLRCSDPLAPANCNGQPYRPVDSFASSSWQNANAASDGWSR